MKRTNFYVYIIANFTNTTFYIGVTNDLEKRLFEHRNRLVKGFSKKYNLSKLVYFEHCSNVEGAITREKQLKNWHRDWKLNLIKTINPYLLDLDPTLEDAETSSA
jgi:putative endonuclease